MGLIRGFGVLLSSNYRRRFTQLNNTCDACIQVRAWYHFELFWSR